MWFREVLKKKKNIIKDLALISDKYKVDSDILVALWGVESFYGKNLCNFIIINSLASLSFDGRRKKFFLNQLKNSLEIIEKNNFSIKDYKGSWAGAFGQTQFMPSTFLNYAVDYNGDGIKDLKKNSLDALASGANYLKKMGWKKNEPCFIKVNLKSNIPIKYLNTSARKIKNKKKINFFKKYIKNLDAININENINSAIIIPDKDIIPGAQTLSPAYVVFDNYEKILKWNRSLRFALAVCTLKENFENEI